MPDSFSSLIYFITTSEPRLNKEVVKDETKVKPISFDYSRKSVYKSIKVQVDSDSILMIPLKTPK